MNITTTPDTIWVHTQVFPSWTVDIPRSLIPIDPRTAADESYWHARDEHRSVSISSMTLFDTAAGIPVPGSLIVKTVAAQVLPRGRRIKETPAGLPSRAVYAKGLGSRVAEHALQGIVAAEGVVLIATITSDDEAWCRRVWSSIRHTPELAAAMEAQGLRTEPVVGAGSA
jgi:hypothetical protein